MSDLETLSARWLACKKAEQAAQAERRECEDKMLSLIGISETHDGTTNAEAGGLYKIKVASRMSYAVDSDLVQELAAEAGCESALSEIFRWKPELNKKQWEHCAENIRAALAPAITTKPSRPTFTITQNEE